MQKAMLRICCFLLGIFLWNPNKIYSRTILGRTRHHPQQFPRCKGSVPLLFIRPSHSLVSLNSTQKFNTLKQPNLPFTSVLPKTRQFAILPGLAKNCRSIHFKKTLKNICTSSVYFAPLLDCCQYYLDPLSLRYPSMQKLWTTLSTIRNRYNSIPLLSFGLYSGIYYAIIQRDWFESPYFLKYHVVQMLILAAFQYSTSMIYYRLNPFTPLQESMVQDVAILSLTMSNLYWISLSAYGALRGKKPRIPVISDAVELHIGVENSKDTQNAVDF